jgi:cyclic pyranopterin phosphate synthase
VSVVDLLGRPLGALRISVTDRCNLRCRYCMPAAAYRWLPADSLLSFDELTRVAAIFASQGVSKLRLTGGEPLLRPRLDRLVARLAALDGIVDLALTTNATRLAPMARPLRAAGLRRVTVSLDTLRPERMRQLARHDRFAEVEAGIAAAQDAGFESIKLNTVVMRGVNDDELADLVRYARERGLEPRFIEYMDVGGALEWQADQVVSGAEIVATLADQFGGALPLPRADDPHAPAARWQLGTGGTVGVVTSTTQPFCRDCDRSRLTADGQWYRCLYAEQGTDLAAALRGGADDGALSAIIRRGWAARSDRGAEARAALPDRGALVPLTRLRADPRLEMHVRGG